jgi:deoxyribonucleoside regulator
MHFSQEERYYLKLKAAHLLYLENMNLSDIAVLLHISRPTLNKLLSEARAEGIVSISINDIRQSESYISFEQALRKLLDLKDVKIVNVSGKSQDAVNQSIGEAAAAYFSNLISSGMRVGIGWGNTLQYMAKFLRPDPSVRDSEFVSLMGGLSSHESSSYAMFANSLCEIFASNYKRSKVAMIHAPILAQSKKDAAALLRASGVSESFGKMSELDVAIVGIDGDIDHSTTLELDKSIRAVLAEMKDKNCAGNVCARFYTEEGRTGVMSIEDRLLSISDKDLIKTSLVVGAAGGPYKARSIIGASRAKLFDILITDVATAKTIEAIMRQ